MFNPEHNLRPLKNISPALYQQILKVHFSKAQNLHTKKVFFHRRLCRGSHAKKVLKEQLKVIDDLWAECPKRVSRHCPNPVSHRWNLEGVKPLKSEITPRTAGNSMTRIGEALSGTNFEHN